jgi:uncharacterized membrane protein
VRRRRLPEGESFLLVVELDVKGWWAAQDRTNRVLYAILAGALLVAFASAVALVLLSKPGERFTEFYLLGPEGLAENYPCQATVGQPLTVTVGIANQEGVPSDYQVYVISDELVIGESGPVHLEPGAADERPLSFTPLAAADDVEVLFYLYRDGVEGHYRSLRLWLEVTGTG